MKIVEPICYRFVRKLNYKKILKNEQRVKICLETRRRNGSSSSYKQTNWLGKPQTNAANFTYDKNKNKCNGSNKREMKESESRNEKGKNDRHNEEESNNTVQLRDEPKEKMERYKHKYDQTYRHRETTEDWRKEFKSNEKIDFEKQASLRSIETENGSIDNIDADHLQSNEVISTESTLRAFHRVRSHEAKGTEVVYDDDNKR